MRRNRCSFAALLVALSFMAASAAHALPESQIGSIKKTIVNTPVIELGPTAAKLVKEANEQDRQTVAVTVVRTAVFRKPSSAVAVVEAVVKVAPETAARVAAAAAELAPEQAALIVKVATAGSPEKAPVIASVVAKVAPSSARLITRAAMISAPGLTPQIVSEVISAAPGQAQAIKTDRLIGSISSIATLGQQAGAGGGSGGTFVTFPTDEGTPDSSGAGTGQGRSTELNDLINSLSGFSAADQATILAEASKIVNAALSQPSLSGTDKNTIQDAALSGLSSILNDSNLSAADKAAFISGASSGLAQIIQSAPSGNKSQFTSTAVSALLSLSTASSLTGEQKTGLIGPTLSLLGSITADPELAGNAFGQSTLLNFVVTVLNQVNSLNTANYTQAELQAIINNTVNLVNGALSQPGNPVDQLTSIQNQVQNQINQYASP